MDCGVVLSNGTTFDATTILGVQIYLIILCFLFLISIISCLVVVKITHSISEFSNFAVGYYTFSMLGSICTMIAFIPFIYAYPASLPLWCVFLFYLGFPIFLSPLIVHTWYLLCILMKPMPHFPFVIYAAGAIHLRKATIKQMWEDRYFVWKRIPILILPPLLALIIMSTRKDVDEATAFMYGTSFLDPYNQFLVFLLLFLTLIFVGNYIKRSFQTTHISISSGDKARKKFVMKQSLLVMTRAIMTIVYALCCELALWFILLNRGDTLPGLMHLAIPYVVTSATMHCLINGLSIGILFYPVFTEHNSSSSDFNIATTENDT